MTRSTPSTIEAIKTPSVKAAIGGESIMTCAKLGVTEAMSLSIWSDPTSSAGFGGTGPAVRRCNPEPSSYWIADEISASPTSLDRSELRPTALLRSKIECSRGRRISQSITKTLTPVCARLIAVFMAVVVLPSEGTLEVIKRVLGGFPAVDKRMDV